MAENRIDPNRAEAEELRQLPGIGPELAQRIVDGRPYRSVEDLLTVSGLGSRTLERIRPRLSFEATESRPDEAVLEPAAEPEATGAPEDEKAPEASEAREPERKADRPAPRPAGLRQPSDGRRTLWSALTIGAASVLCSVSLTLLVLLGVNGTLDYGRHAAVRRAESRISQLESDLNDTTAELNGLRQRLQVIESLSGRMTELEGRVDQLQQQLEGMASSVDALQQQVEALQEQGDRIDRIDSFLAGLQQLLNELFPVPEG